MRRTHLNRTSNRQVIGLILMALAIVIEPSIGRSGETVFEDFKNNRKDRWHFFADTVMGGVSTGRVEFIEEDSDSYLRMTGHVSTENNGGFIQVRRKITEPLSPELSGIRLLVRGNDQRYFVHLRTTGTILPWQYYQAGFETTSQWSEVTLPFSAFKASGTLLRRTPRPDSIKSIGLVAFGRNHDAQLEVREIRFNH